MAISISTVAGIVFNFFYGGFMTFLTCSLAGGIAALSAIPYIIYPYLGLAIGGGTAILQYMMYLLDKYLYKKFGILDPFRHVFLAQAILGVFWALMALAIELESKNDTTTTGVPLIAAGFMSIGIGLGVGIVLGIIFTLIVYRH